MTLVRIIASKPVHYSLDNGITRSEFASGEVYNVPDWVGASMIRRGWAKEVQAEELADKDDAEPEVDLSELRQVDESKRRKKKE